MIFFGTIAKKYPGLGNGAEGVRIIRPYNRSMTGTDYINFEIRNFYKYPDSSLFNMKTKDKISAIVSKDNQIQKKSSKFI